MDTSTDTQLPCFAGVKHLTAWLTSHPRGREILDEAVRQWIYGWEGRDFVDQQVNLRAAESRPVLIVVGTYTGDFPPHTWIRCYSSHLCSFKFLQTPHATKHATEELLEEYVSMTVKARHRNLFNGLRVNGQPGLQAQHVCRRITADSLLAAKLEVEVIEESRQLGRRE